MIHSTEAQLLLDARKLAGMTVAEVAAGAGVDVPVELRRAKGFVGSLIERALGVSAPKGRSGPDVPSLGVEIKTIPVRRDGRPRESTFVCSVSLAKLVEETWETSAVRAKLGRVLWVPVEHDARLPVAGRRIGTAFCWSPSAADETVLESDWERLRDTVARGAIESIDARMGRALQLRPKADNGAARVRAAGELDAPVRVVPRGFYLRARFTRTIVDRAGLLRARATGLLSGARSVG